MFLTSSSLHLVWVVFSTASWNIASALEMRSVPTSVYDPRLHLSRCLCFLSSPTASSTKSPINFVIDETNLGNELKKNLITCKVDDGGQAIGKRYARTDEIGIPFAITIDYDTLKDNTVTLRELNTLKQVRIPSTEVVKVIVDLSEQFIDWHSVLTKYPAYESKEEEKE
jgi:hypothetical protein